jgi:hypothetical protein
MKRRILWSGTLLCALTLPASLARAADPAPPPAAVAPPPGALPAPPAPPPLPPGTKIGAAEVPIVGGNVASARERGLTEALKQAIDQSITALAPDLRAKQPKTVNQLLGKARTFVRRYRTIEEGEAGRGRYAVKLEVDVDEPALRRALDSGPSGTPSGAAVNASYLLVGTGPDDAVEAVARSLAAGGAKVERAPHDQREQARAMEGAARSGLGAIAFVNASATPEGQVRGLGLEAVSCTLSLRLVATGSGLALGDESRALRSFSERGIDDARKECLARAAGGLVHALAPNAGARGGTDLRTIVVDADVVEPAVVSTLLKQLRATASVSSVDIRRILPGRIEVWVRSRLNGSALAGVLGREGATTLALTAFEVTGDLIRLRARMPEVPAIPPGAAPPAPGDPAAAAVPAPGKATGP